MRRLATAIIILLFLSGCASVSGNGIETKATPDSYEAYNKAIADAYFKAAKDHVVLQVEAYDDKPGIKSITLGGEFPALQYPQDKWAARINSVATLVGAATPAIATGFVVSGFKAAFDAAGDKTTTVEVGSHNRQSVASSGEGAASAQMPSGDYRPSSTSTTSTNKGDSLLDLF